MKHQIIPILNRHIVADHIVLRLVQSLCVLTGIVLLFLPVWTLSALDLSKAQMIFGVLLSLNSAVLFIVLGLLMPLAVAPKNAR